MSGQNSGQAAQRGELDSDTLKIEVLLGNRAQNPEDRCEQTAHTYQSQREAAGGAGQGGPSESTQLRSRVGGRHADKLAASFREGHKLIRK